MVLEDPAALLTVPTPQAPHAADRKPETPASEEELGSRAACWALRFRGPELGRHLVAEAIGCGPRCAPSLPLHTPLRLNDASRWGSVRKRVSDWRRGRSCPRIGQGGGTGQRTHVRGGAAERGQ